MQAALEDNKVLSGVVEEVELAVLLPLSLVEGGGGGEEDGDGEGDGGGDGGDVAGHEQYQPEQLLPPPGGASHGLSPRYEESTKRQVVDE